jgi:hypothetical protein
MSGWTPAQVFWTLFGFGPAVAVPLYGMMMVLFSQPGGARIE